MSNIHALQDEDNKHTAKGFDLVGNNTRLWKDENSEQTFTENNELPRAINFVDGTAAAPTSVDGDIYVLTGSGVVDASWGASTFGDWTRAKNTIFTPITPVKGMLCYDDTASAWMEFDGSIWAAFGGGATNLSEGTSTTTTVDVDSDTGTNATLQPASTIRAGVMSKAKFDEVELNNAKVTNATHTGEVLGSGVLTVDPTAVSNKALITASGTMEVLVNDAGTLKKVVASDFLGGGDNLYTADGTLTGARTVTMGTNGIDFVNGFININSAVDGASSRLRVRGVNTDNAVNCIYAEDSTGREMLSLRNSGRLYTNGFSGTTGIFSKNIDTTGYLQYKHENDVGSVGILMSTGSATNSVFGTVWDNGAFGLVKESGSNLIFGTRSNSTHMKFYINTGEDANVRMKVTNTGTAIGHAVGALVPTAQLHVKGANQLGTSSALLIEDSAGNDLLDVRNNGATGLYGATPVIQATTAGAPSIITAGVGTTVKHDDLFDGYTLAQISKALRNLGVLA